MAALRDLATCFITSELKQNPATITFANNFTRDDYVGELQKRPDGQEWLVANHLLPRPAAVEVLVDDGFVEPPQIFPTDYMQEEFQEERVEIHLPIPLRVKDNAWWKYVIGKPKGENNE